MGVRVPMVVISPWAKRGIDHTTYDFTSVLKFIGEDFGLPHPQRARAAGELAPRRLPVPKPLPRWTAPVRTCPAISAGQLAATGKHVDPS